MQRWFTRKHSWLLASLIPLLTGGRLLAATDPRYKPITPEELKQAVNTLPLSSAQLRIDLDRAVYCHLTSYAYQIYKRLYELHPKDVHAQILAAIAAYRYRQTVTDPGMRGAGPYTADETRGASESESLLISCLETAVKTDRSGIAASRLGDYLYLRASNQDEQERAMALLRRGVELNPGSTEVHNNLGYCLCLPQRRYLDPIRGAKEIKRAMQLDPTWAAPHLALAHFDYNEKHYKESLAELKAHVALLPPGAAAGNSLIIMLCRWLNVKLEDLSGTPRT